MHASMHALHVTYTCGIYVYKYCMHVFCMLNVFSSLELTPSVLVALIIRLSDKAFFGNWNAPLFSLGLSEAYTYII